MSQYINAIIIAIAEEKAGHDDSDGYSTIYEKKIEKGGLKKGCNTHWK